MSLTRKLYRCRLQPGKSVSEHLQKMKELFNELEQRDMQFPENHKVYVMLRSLAEDYDVLVTSLESMDEEELTREYLTGRLLEEEQRRSERSNSKMKHDNL